MKQSIFDLYHKYGIWIHPLQVSAKNPIAPGWNSSARRQDNPLANYSGNVGLMVGSPIYAGDRIRGFVTVIDLDKKDEVTTPELLAKYETEKLDFINKIGSFIPGTDDEKKNYLRWIERTGGRGGLHIMLNFFLPFRHKKIKLEYDTFTLALHGITDKLRYENVVVWPSKVENYYTHVVLSGDPESDEYIAKVDEILDVFCSHRIDFVEYEAFYNFLFPSENYYERLRTVLFPFTIYTDDFCYDFYGKMLSGWCLRAGVAKEKYLNLLENTHFHKNGKNITYENIIKLVDKTYRENKVDSYPGWSAIVKALQVQGDQLFADSKYISLMISAVDFYLNRYFGIVRDGEVPKINLQAVKRSKWDIYELNDTEIEAESGKYSAFVGQSMDMLNLSVPILDNLVEEAEFLTRGDVVMAFGGDATRKTWLFMDACHSLSKGEPFWGGRFTPKRKCRIVYFYADRTMAKHVGDYIRPFQSYDPEYLTYIYVKDLWRINKNFKFDISSSATWAYITKVVGPKTDMIVFDSWHGCGSCSDFYDKNTMAEFMSYLIRFSNVHQLVTAIVHHSNKQNTKEMRNIILGKDDYQGAKIISSQMSYTFVINPVPNTKGKFSFTVGKEGMTDFPSFFYTLENYLDEKDIHRVRMNYEDYDQEKMAEEIMRTKYDVFKFKLIKQINNNILSAVALKSYFNVGKMMSHSLWKKYLKQLQDESLIIGYGDVHNRKYKLLPKGIEMVDNIPEIEVLLDITKIPIDQPTDQITDATAGSMILSGDTSTACVVTDSPVIQALTDSSSVADILRAKQFSERAMAIEASIDLDRPRMLTIDTSKVEIKSIPEFAAEYESKKIIMDIESESADSEKFDVSPIYCIGVKTATETIILENGDDEKTMLERFNEILKNIMMREFWICGHNIISYDLQHIIVRMQLHGIICPLHWKRRMTGDLCEWHHDFKNGIKTHYIPECGMLQFIDTLFLVHYYDNQKAILSGYGLKVCAVELGFRASPRLELSFSEILDCWKNNKPRLFEYLKYDLDDTDFLAKLLLPSYYYMEKYL